MQAFIVKREDTRTVIAGYPWFLDWGRDTLICLRGIIAAGMHDESRDILIQFARFEDRGTLPNMIRGNDDSNRDTTDAPLWFFTACADYIKADPKSNFLAADCRGRTIREILISIASHYIDGTPNNIKMDPDSALIFSPSHYTWMDTNHPAGTPREGYPIEIQALWFAALRFLAEIDDNPRWLQLSQQVQTSIKELYTLPDRSYLADCLLAAPGTPAKNAVPDNALRPNQLFAITLGAITDTQQALDIITAAETLLIPGAIRSLADQPVAPPLPVYRDGTLLNDPEKPYWGYYGGDEDTRRKPAYHNGTAWSWPFPSYCEALYKTDKKNLKATALSILSSGELLANSGCINHIPEILDGNTPHTQRGCQAQAWGDTELYRVLKLLTQ
jgi:predicted glycogen debranching enzyme